jgi:MerR family transcriptional regulator, light-induced transcriptional regulator
MSGTHPRIAEVLTGRIDELAARITEIHLHRVPEFVERFGDAGRRRCLEDAVFHLRYLAQALRYGNPGLFTAYVQWLRQLLEARRISWDDLQANLGILREEVARDLGTDDAAVVAGYIDAALAAAPPESGSFISGTPREALAHAYLTTLLRAERRSANAMVDAAMRDGLSIRDLYLDVFQPVQREIGRLWQNNMISVAEEHYCTASTQALMAQFYPEILATPRIGRKVVVACVGSELHEIGTRMVADFFELKGWDGIYIGANTPTGALVELVCRERPQLVALGITMTYHLPVAGELVRALRNDERCADVKVIVGGYVFQQRPELWRALGADGSAGDAAEAVEIGENLIDDSRPGR